MCPNPKCRGYGKQPLEYAQWVKSCPICGLVMAYMRGESKRRRVYPVKHERVRIRTRVRVK